MEELLEDRRSTAMSNTNPSSSSTLRFLGFIKQPESAAAPIHDPLELHESDVVWSFAVSPAVPPPSPPPRHRYNFSPAKSGLSAALTDDHRHLIRRKSTVNHTIVPAATRPEEIPSRFHQSAPMNIPMWPKELHRKHGNGDLDGFDEVEVVEDDDAVEGEDEMVPPHVIVARSHVTFSVFEGAGRTLKGRDLRRVRNAVFQKTDHMRCGSSTQPSRYLKTFDDMRGCVSFDQEMSESIRWPNKLLSDHPWEKEMLRTQLSSIQRESEIIFSVA